DSIRTRRGLGPGRSALGPCVLRSGRRHEKRGAATGAPLLDSGTTGRRSGNVDSSVQEARGNGLRLLFGGHRARAAQASVGGGWHHGQLNRWQPNAQLISPTSHCAILRASPISHLRSGTTSQASGCANGPAPHWRTCTSYWATTRASPMSNAPSPFTSPQSVIVILPGTRTDGTTRAFASEAAVMS